MPLLVVALVVAVLLLWTSLANLKARVDRDQHLQIDRDERLNELRSRLAALEADRPPATPPARPVPVPAAPDAPPAMPSRPPVQPSARPVIAPPVVLVPLSPPSQQEPVPQSAPDEAWEVVVGTNWLNKLGVLTFVIGVALLVAYSMTHIGPLGRVLIGDVLGAGLLAAGVALERRALYRQYAYGLIAGGWAAIYFTAFAMHALPSARIVDSDLIGTASLLVVAAGMIAHSLRYRSPTVTALAYLAAYATLALTPLSGFSLVASVPLAVSLLVVAQRFGWSTISLLGVAATYGLFVLRQGVLIPAAEAADLMPYVALAVYWITFEAADIIGLRYGAHTDDASAPQVSSMFGLNAAGLLGAALLEAQVRNTSVPPAWIAVGGVAFLLSGVIRSRIAATERSSSPAPPFTTMHAAVAISAALIGWSMHRAFATSRETVALLMETEMLVAAGWALSDRHVGRIGAALALVVSGQALGAFASTAMSAPFLSLSSPAMMLTLVAAAWYVNRETSRRMAASMEVYAPGFTWVALLFLGLVVREEIAPAYQALAGLIFVAILLEAGTRAAPEYRHQGYVSCVAAIFAMANVFVLSPITPVTSDVWAVLPASAALSYAIAWRLARQAPAAPARAELLAAAGGIACAGTLCLAVFEWRLLDETHVAPAWAATAIVILVAGLVPRAHGKTALRLQAYAFLLAAIVMAMRFFAPDVAADVRASAVLPACVVIGLLYLASLTGRRAFRDGIATSDLEQVLRICTSLAATSALSVLLWRQLQPAAVTLAWGLEGSALLAAGFPARERALRISGLAVLLLCILKLFLNDLGQLEPLPRILSFVVLGMLLLAVSWAYTRFKPQFRRFL